MVARAEKGYTLRRLSEACGINDKLISRYSNGCSFPEPYTLSKIAEALGVRPCDLAPGTEEIMRRMG